MSPTPSSNHPEAPELTADDGVSANKRKDQQPHVAQDATAPEQDLPGELPLEHGGQAGLEPTRYGDWEKKGRCTDF